MISIGNLQINKLCLGNLEVVKAYLGDVEVYGSTKKYMTMTVLDGDAGTTISPTVTGTLSPNLQYRVNNGSWNDFIVGTTADIHAVAGDVVQWKGVNESGISTSDKNYLKFSISGNPVSLSGNVMSLIDGIGDALVIPHDYCFYKMFSQSNVKTVSLDFLPATTLTTWCYSDLFSESLLENAPELPALIMKDNCYRGMFYGCQNFTQAPELQSTTLAPFCYQGMFQNCSSLTTAPVLPAMTLKERCYYYMFYGCSSLTQAPVLPATTLAPYCYNNMFCLCTSLTTAPVLPATTLADYCYAYMFYDCHSLVNVHELPATTLAPNCYRSMFYRCTSLTQAPVLPATTLANNCYQFMFWGCSNLTQAPELPATELAQYCYNQMFCNCTSLTQAPVLPATTLVDYCYQYMFYGGSNLNYVKSLATNITATNALTGWLSGVASSGTFVKPAGVSYVTGDSGIPNGWTVVEDKPKPEGKYMTMTVLDGTEGTVISPKITGSLPNLNLQYRINSNGDWTNFIVGTTANIKVVSGDWIQFKGVNESGISTSTSNYLNFAISGNPVSLSGNIMSLIDGVGDALEIPCNYCFYKIFSTSNVKTVSSDFLPAKTIAGSCYSSMFHQCSSLVQSPKLPATKLYWECYKYMFNGCTSLTQAPELPATTLADGCYKDMFNGCTSLTQAPILHATTITNSCYSHMFQHCTSLTKAPELPATTLDVNCYWSMFEGCTSLTKAPELPATTLAQCCYQYMFNGCTSLTQAPELPATTLAIYCYGYMFKGCTSLTKAPELPATTLTTQCYEYMFMGCSNLSYVKCLAKNPNVGSLDNWLSGVASKGTFVKPSSVSYETGKSGIPYGWTVVEEKPKPEGKYMTITVDDNAGETTITPSVTGSLPNLNLQYRINSNGDWTNFIVGKTADIHLVAGDWIQFKGVNESGISTSTSNYLNFAISGNPVSLSGNVMSLIDGVGDALVIPNDYCFYSLFSSSKVKTVSSDFLPATTLTYGCYQDMFGSCSILIQAPELPATKLEQYCYKEMFRYCTSLTTAPALPATTLEKYCYQYMFNGCSSLNYVKCTARNITATGALENWLNSVAQTGTFVKRSGISYPSGASGIPSRWTIQNI